MPIRTFVALLLATVAGAARAGDALAGDAAAVSLPALVCTPEQTGGFHDYPGGEERYEPALFHPRPFELKENEVLTMTLAGTEGAPDLFATLTVTLPDNGGQELTELECRQVRGADGSLGFSCVNLPPSEMLLINAQTFRFTRTSVGGWTFAGAAGNLNGDSIFVEYGSCRPAGDTPLGKSSP
jgi:hypothetical protein